MRHSAPARERSPSREFALSDKLWTWSNRIGKILLILVSLELGIFLLLFPWSEAWQTNNLSFLFPPLERIWGNFYFRGAISGLGVLNLFVFINEVRELLAGRSSNAKRQPGDPGNQDQP